MVRGALDLASKVKTIARLVRQDFNLSVGDAYLDPQLVDAVVAPWFSEPHSLRMMMLSGTPRRGRKGLLWLATKSWPLLDPSVYFGFDATAYDAPKLVDAADEWGKRSGIEAADQVSQNPSKQAW